MKLRLLSLSRNNNMGYYERGDFIKYFIIFAIALAMISIMVSLLVNPVMGIFVVSTIACLWLERLDRRDRIKQNLDKDEA